MTRGSRTVVVGNDSDALVRVASGRACHGLWNYSDVGRTTSPRLPALLFALSVFVSPGSPVPLPWIALNMAGESPSSRSRTASDGQRERTPHAGGSPMGGGQGPAEP